MALLFRIPGPLRHLTQEKSEVMISNSKEIENVGSALEALWRVHPGLRDRIVTEQNEVRTHVNIFVGNESIRSTGGLNSIVGSDTEISIVPSVSGGVDDASGGQ